MGEREGWEHPGFACSRWCGPEAWQSSAGASGIRGSAFSPLLPRLIKGDGEILEEIVTKERHREINKVGCRPFAWDPPPFLFVMCPFPCAFFPSKPPEGMA